MRTYKYEQAVVADGSGDATVYFGKHVNGIVRAIKYVPGTLATGADLVFTGEDSGVPILTKANAGTSTVWFFPQALGNLNTTGAAMTDFGVPIYVFEERIKLVVADGGALGAGTVTVYTEE